MIVVSVVAVGGGGGGGRDGQDCDEQTHLQRIKYGGVSAIVRSL